MLRLRLRLVLLLASASSSSSLSTRVPVSHAALVGQQHLKWLRDRDIMMLGASQAASAAGVIMNQGATFWTTGTFGPETVPLQADSKKTRKASSLFQLQVRKPQHHDVSIVDQLLRLQARGVSGSGRGRVTQAWCSRRGIETDSKVASTAVDFAHALSPRSRVGNC